MISNIVLLISFSSIAAILAWWRKYLTLPAGVLAAIFGSVIALFAGLAIAVSVAGCFFITSWLSGSQTPQPQLNPLTNDSRRTAFQVLANGLVLVLLAITYYLNFTSPFITTAALLGCIAAVSGDTWASEIGPLSKSLPRLLFSSKPVPRGTPGAITVVGIYVSGFAGVIATLIFLMSDWVLIGTQYSLLPILILMLSAIAGGLFGALADSFLGAYVQAIYRTSSGQICDDVCDQLAQANEYIQGWRWMSNNWVNFFNSVVGASCGIAIATIFEHLH